MMARIDEWAADLASPGARNIARWGSQASRYGTYQGEVDHFKDWLTRRAAWIDQQFVPIPVLDPAGGTLARGTAVEVGVDEEATIYYTLDGADPQGSGSSPSATAVKYTGPVAIDANEKLSARALFADGVWSPLVQGVYIVDPLRLAVTEIMYRPPAPTAQEDPTGKIKAAQMDFIELRNVGDKPISLAGVRFTKGLTSDLSSFGAVPPGGLLLLVSDKNGFAARYGAIPVTGQYTGLLGDYSTRLTLAGPLGETIFDFTYSSTWYTETAGNGYSLVNVDPAGDPAGLGTKTRWKPSKNRLGSPGVDELNTGLREPGDVTGDGTVDLGDAILLVFHVAGQPVTPPCGGAATDAGNVAILDFNGDGKVDLTDAIGELRYLFLSGAKHVLGESCVAVTGCPDACK
jgi:hypothetical protein